MKDKLTKEQQQELEQLALEIEAEAIQMKLDYENNPTPTEESGSLIYVHENSEFLDEDFQSVTDLDDKPVASSKVSVKDVPSIKSI